jgi:SAM-dependent methyltransferase
MANWDDGYVTDVPYVTGYHRETAPIWIATAAALLGVMVPEPTGPIRYADLGCGNGVTALITAATMPNAEIWAFDFNPAHIAAGRDIALRAGLDNIHFEEASFEHLAGIPGDALPKFDYVVAHGIFSWVSKENRRWLVNLIGQRLAPGGIAYVSYNVATGWAGMRPVRALMRLLADVSPERSDLAVTGGFELLDKMKAAGAAMFQTHPSLGPRLAEFRGFDQRYVAHELLNREWHPAMFPAVASEMAEVKCDYIGSATVQDNVGGLTVPNGLLGMFDSLRDSNLRELFRDIANAATFRRDLYQRGTRRLTPAEHKSRIDAIRLVRTFQPVAEPLVLPSALGGMTADALRYPAVLRALEDGSRTIGALRGHDGLSDWTDQALMEAVSMLMGGGYLAPMLEETPGDVAMRASSRLNGVYAGLFELGHTQLYWAHPALGTAWRTNGLEILALDELRMGRTANEESLVSALLDRITRGGSKLFLNGQPIIESEAARAMVTEGVREVVRRLPAMRQFGFDTTSSGATATVGAA